ncbi:ectonucleoside triphosphate diphosphohydrolase 2 isoform X2 [Puntigrus tetrazona]|uniref:ectonucleoside triphosphate diphosphohydrolase 2 isoform X2 n=1 Tax=Puntigrus tetrazona TaxID=1606681 RepID=UPI001C8A86EE|nr:ectonucleoside triphosphate diphosphohydrolase 2 isoform X2 [Puntigrus tetrazona]
MDKPFVKFVVSAALFLFGIVSIVLLTVFINEMREPPQYMYGVVLDAGSSHTALYIYRWPADKLNGTGVVTQHSECHVRGGGISSYAGQLDAAARSLEACLKQAMRDIPPERHHHTPVYLGATAGMRLLKITNPGKASQILQEVKQKIKSFPFNFRGAVILSGQEEGVYGWVTVNYLLENFIKLQGNSTKVYHPCYPSDFTDVFKLEQVFDSPCTASKRPKPYNPHSWIRVQGTGDYQSCLGNTSNIFSFQFCPFSKCSFNGVFQPNISGGFMAFSAYFFTHSYLQQSTGINIRTSAQLEEATQAVCNMTIKEMTEKAPYLKKYLKDYCAVAVYIQVLLLRGYNFDESSFQNVAFQKKAGEASVGWALGYILSVSSLLPEEPAGIRKGLRPAAWIGLLILLTVLLTSTFCYMALLVIRRKMSNEGVS